jgi:hypothetical protein
MLLWQGSGAIIAVILAVMVDLAVTRIILIFLALLNAVGFIEGLRNRRHGM